MKKSEYKLFEQFLRNIFLFFLINKIIIDLFNKLKIFPIYLDI